MRPAYSPRIHLISDVDLSLPSHLTGKQSITLFRCCFVPIIIKSGVSTLSFNLLDAIHNKMSVRQSFKVDNLT